MLIRIFRGVALLRWFDPVRPTLTGIGMGLLAFAIRSEWQKRRISVSGAPSGGGILCGDLEKVLWIVTRP